MRTLLVIVSFALALIVPLFAQAAEQALEARRTELNRLLADEWEYTLRTQPELATQVGDDRYNDRLSDFSDKAIADDHRTHAPGPGALRSRRRHRLSRAGKTQPRADAAQPARGARRRAIQRLGDAGDAVWRHSPRVRVARIRFPFPQREGLRRLSITSAPDPARARASHGAHARRTARPAHAAEVFARKSIRTGAADCRRPTRQKSFYRTAAQVPRFHLRGGPQATT